MQTQGPVQTDPAAKRAVELANEAVRIAGGGGGSGAAAQTEAAARLVAAAGGDRAILEAARDVLARRLHVDPTDPDATAGLTVLNRAVAEVPAANPFDWQVRWKRHRKP